MHIKRGMIIKVISGNHKGMEGKVLNVFPKNNRIVVEGVNFRKRAIRPTQENQSGGFSEREASIHISNVMVLQNGQVSRIGHKILEDGSKVRIFKKTNEETQIQ